MRALTIVSKIVLFVIIFGLFIIVIEFMRPSLSLLRFPDMSLRNIIIGVAGVIGAATGANYFTNLILGTEKKKVALSKKEEAEIIGLIEDGNEKLAIVKVDEMIGAGLKTSKIYVAKVAEKHRENMIENSN